MVTMFESLAFTTTSTWFPLGLELSGQSGTLRLRRVLSSNGYIEPQLVKGPKSGPNLHNTDI
jgi:hypothetical protein